MKKFTLLIGGKDLDTGVYDYFPYTDKVITDFRNIRRIIKELKEGKAPNNADDYVYAQYCLNNDDTNLIAIESAYNAFLKFRDFSLGKRKKIFLDMYKLLLENKEEFIRLLIIEGHPRKLAEWEFEGMRMGGSQETIGFYCKELHREIGRYKKEILYLTRRPDGVICINAPGNASASSSYNGALAFLVGNAVIIKPSLQSPVSSIFLWKEVVHKALLQNNAPPGILNIILGNSRTILHEWLSSNYVNDIMHFGDTKTGLGIGAKIFQAGKKPILELSGNDILIVWKDGDIEKASDSLIDCFLGSTQICMVPKMALIHQDIYGAFVKKFLDKVQNLKVSLPTNPDTILSPVIRIADFFNFMNDALEKGATLLYGGERLDYLNQVDSKNGIYIRPTLIEIDDYEKALTMRCIKEEIFFPLLPLIKISGKDDEVFKKMVYFVDSHSYGIRASLWISSPKYLRKFVKQLYNCGMFRINSRHIGFSYYLSTHGGTKKSGGPFGEMNYFWQKTSHLQGISRIIK